MDLCPAISSLSAGIIGRIRHKSGVSKGQVVPRCALPEAIVTPNGSGSVAEASGGAARHMRAWSADAPAVVAGCRRLRSMPLSC